jgi:hypothetical protein
MECPGRVREQRASIRFNKVFQVQISSEDFGEVHAVARNISTGGMQLETPATLPLGAVLEVRFQIPDSDASLIARAEVKNHYVFNYVEDGALRWARGMGVRFLEFLSDNGQATLRSSLRMRTLH